MQNNIELTPHFKLREFTESATAEKHGIDNTPPPEVKENLRRLCVHTLEPLREAMGLPVIITSGYRCKALNERITHHSIRSQHMEGCAADFYVGQPQGSGFRFQVSGTDDKHLEHETGESPMKLETSSRRELLIKAFRQIILDEKIDYDQLIIYPSFIHVSYISRERNRRRLTKANGNGHYCALTRTEALALI